MLALPFKKVPENDEEKVEFVKIVGKWVEEEFGEGEASRYRVRLRSVDTARNAALEAIAELVKQQGLAAEAVGQRTQVNELSNDGEANERLLKPLRRYAFELLSIERRTECDLSGISWQDAWPKEETSSSSFASGGKRLLAALKKKSNDNFTAYNTVVQGGLSLERWSLLYNLACAETIAGAGLERGSEQGIRAACRHFQRAAGIFSYLRKSAQNQTSSEISSQRDSTPAALLIAENTALAQAQACFYEKAIASEQVNAGVVAKLAAQAAAYYWRARAALPTPSGLVGSNLEDTSRTPPTTSDTPFLPPGQTTDTMNDPVLVSSTVSSTQHEREHFPSLQTQRSLIMKQWPRAPEYVEKTSSKLTEAHEAWAIHLEFQARCFEAASALWSSRKIGQDASNSGNGYGLQLSWLRRCGRWCSSALIVAELDGSRVTAEAARGATGLREHAAAQFSALERDNDTIYRERLPEDNELPLVHGVPLAKPAKPESWLVGCSGSSPARVALCAQQAVSGGGFKLRPSALRGLLPRSARSAVAAHAENAQRAARQALALAADGDDLERAALASLELPQALNDLDDCSSFAHHGALPESLTRRAAEAMPDQTPAEQSLRGAYGRLESARSKALVAIEEAAKIVLPNEDNDSIHDTQASTRLSRMLGIPDAEDSSPKTAKQRQELRELKEQTSLGAKTDAALMARLDDAEVVASLAALDEAMERHRGNQSPQKTQSVGEEVTLAVAECRAALTRLRANGEEWTKAARQLEIAATQEAQAAVDALDSLADAGLPLLAHHEPYDSDILSSSADESTTDDEEPPWLVPTVHTNIRRSISRNLDASAAIRLFLETRFKRIIETPAAQAQACAEKQHELVEALAAARHECSAAARRDSAARAARDALTRVADGARNMEQLALSLAEGASFYLELQRRAHALANGEFTRSIQSPNLHVPITNSVDTSISFNAATSFDPPPPPQSVGANQSPRYLQRLETPPATEPTMLYAGFSESPLLNHEQISNRLKQEQEDEALARRLAAEDQALPAYQQIPNYQPQEKIESSYQEPAVPIYHQQETSPSYQHEEIHTVPSVTPSSIVSRYEPQPRPVYDEQPVSRTTIPLAGEDLVAKILGNSSFRNIPPPYSEPPRPSVTDQEAADLELARRLDREEREEAAKQGTNRAPSYSSVPPPAYQKPFSEPPAYPSPPTSRQETKPAVYQYHLPSPPPADDAPPSAFDVKGNASNYDAPPSAFGGGSTSYATPPSM